MEVHAHSHTAGKKWTHYFWDFLMLFLAVFCGFLAENIREHSVEKHRENILYKLGMHNASGLTAFAIENGLIMKV